MPAYFRSKLADFAETDPAAVLGRLAEGYTRDGFVRQFTESTGAWQEQIRLLRAVALELARLLSASAGWHFLLEYPIPRRPKRIDAVILAAEVIFVLEFKTGSRSLTAADVRQVEDYCLDLRDFHSASARRPLIPLLVGSPASAPYGPPNLLPDEWAQPVQIVSGTTVAGRISDCFLASHRPDSPPIDAEAWDHSPYCPTPTIIEAAQQLYTSHSVQEITRSHAGAENLTKTAQAVLNAISNARIRNRKAICFITGVPGAGKTLAGLNVVHNRELHRDRDALGVFLSGNGPLVKVLTEALARDRRRRFDVRIEEARRTVTTFLQNVHAFLREYATPTAPVPPDHVVLFDEAQRAWDAEQSFRKFRRPESEPALMLGVMDRHRDWAVVVAMVGSGQEINSGEAGLPEWGRALIEQFPHWDVHISPCRAGGEQAGVGHVLFPAGAGPVAVRLNRDLHLSVCLRSYRAKAVAEWVDAVLAGSPGEARRICGEMSDYPVVLTRYLDTARRWLRQQARGKRRAGLIASSGARRLRAYGLDVTAELDEANWFLQPPEDVRSSCFLEAVATEFAVQGLELDWAGVCWDGDLSWGKAGWSFHRFIGTAWQHVRSETKRRFLLNKYRVLLTRAREGVVLWVPSGSDDDLTRHPSLYDGTAEYLLRCGAVSIDPLNG